MKEIRIIFNRYLYLYEKKFLKIKPVGGILFIYNIVLYNDLPQHAQQKFFYLLGSSIKGFDGVYRERKIVDIDEKKYNALGSKRYYKEYQKKYKETHKEQTKKYNKGYYETHKEEYNELFL